MISLLYVSQAQIEPCDRDRVLEDILTVSVARNSTRDITGLLIASPQHFAQLLEGPSLAIEEVMSSITADPRHHALRVIRGTPVHTPSCAWRMARFDSEAFGKGCITRMMIAAHAGEDAGIDRLESLVETLTAGGASPTMGRSLKIGRQ